MEKKQNMTDLMRTIDVVLSQIVWVDSESNMVTLKDLLHRPNSDGSSRSIDDLDRPNLIGAFTSLQIRHELFSVKIADLSNSELAAKIKDLVFFETKAILESKEVSIVDEKVA
ncbi:MAG: hypothetical protein LBR35_00740 [Rickettsiales bacterium]|jgi:hypothetical protein|nr:hypothetical protein [Rickettsiales bacterium]